MTGTIKWILGLINKRMIQDLKNLIESLNCKLRIEKATLYLISTYRFQSLFKDAEEDEQKYVMELIKTNQLKAIKQWMRHQTGERNLSELRSLAKKYSISNYGRLSRAELLRALLPYDKILSVQSRYSTSIE